MPQPTRLLIKSRTEDVVKSTANINRMYFPNMACLCIICSTKQYNLRNNTSVLE